ncbi:DUF6660 family protein [Hymenobacter sp. YC55]|uniref:DUF6660 family protein n=1 Tax=Hymenobacter sp. YC55 TaxID=3034019 RepID=UPI0023F6A53B|nr:DUF6660 family protein [Hymenobacter sp. YC55]MDF7812642.1 hypothetical protein [Hymenobacter sp. YC55]
MRLLALFFSLYFLVLSCRACADEAVRPGTEQTCISASQSGHCPTDSVGDWCPPLCQCHCCPGFALPVVPPLLPTKSRVAVMARAYAAAPVPGLVAHLPTSPWQPPQATC